MRVNFSAKSLTCPEPVFIIATYDENKKADAMNAAWGGIYDTNQIFLCLSSDHKTSKNIKLNKEFTLSFATKEKVTECDYLGIVSANKESDKLGKCHFTTSKASKVNAPIINELPLAIECIVNSLKEENDTLYLVADIVNINADESILTNGKIDSEKLHIISFDPINLVYREISGVVAKAFSEGKKLK